MSEYPQKYHFQVHGTSRHTFTWRRYENISERDFEDFIDWLENVNCAHQVFREFPFPPAQPSDTLLTVTTDISIIDRIPLAETTPVPVIPCYRCDSINYNLSVKVTAYPQGDQSPDVSDSEESDESDTTYIVTGQPHYLQPVPLDETTVHPSRPYPTQ